jgi:hypothetical protein
MTNITSLCHDYCLAKSLDVSYHGGAVSLSGHQSAPENDDKTLFTDGFIDWKFNGNHGCSVAVIEA